MIFALILVTIIALVFLIIEAAEKAAEQNKHDKEVQKYREALRRVWDSK